MYFWLLQVAVTALHEQPDGQAMTQDAVIARYSTVTVTVCEIVVGFAIDILRIHSLLLSLLISLCLHCDVLDATCVAGIPIFCEKVRGCTFAKLTRTLSHA